MVTTQWIPVGADYGYYQVSINGEFATNCDPAELTEVIESLDQDQ